MTAKPPFDQLVRDHGARSARLSAVLGPVDADDAWSETFLAGLRAYPGPAGRRRPRGLAGHDRLPEGDRRRPRRQRRATPIAEQDDRVSTLGQPGSGDDELADAVRSLPDKQRSAVTLHYLADLPYAQVAAELGGTPEAARRAVSDGLRTLRKRLARPTTGGQE